MTQHNKRTTEAKPTPTHTETPWRIEPNGIFASNILPETKVPENSNAPSVIALGIGKANAQIIVTAVNQHEKLTEQVKRLREQLGVANGRLEKLLPYLQFQAVQHLVTEGCINENEQVLRETEAQP